MAASQDVEDVNEVDALSDDEKAAALQQYVDTRKKNSGPERFKAVVSDPRAQDRTLFSSVSKTRCQRWIEQHCPRGQDIFMLAPDGSMWSYEHERHTGGPRGEDVEVWQEFDRSAYSTPELHTVNAHDPWADAWEGAQ